MLTLSRSTIIVAALGGLCWTVKAAVITATDGGFAPVEGMLFVGGLVLLTVAAVLVARDLVRTRGATGALMVAGVAAALVLATTLVMERVQPLIRGLASGGNLGLEQEGGVLVAGVLWLAVAVAAARRSAAPASA
jgi:hypothetical protein